MIIDNENNKLSRNRKRRIERKNKMNNDLKLLLNKINTNKKNKNFDRLEQLESLLVKVKKADKPDKLEEALREVNKIQVVNNNLHEIKNEILLDYVGEFETVGNLKVGDQIRQTNIRFRNINDYEAYINAIDEGYVAEDAIFNGYIHKLTSQFNKKTQS